MKQVDWLIEFRLKQVLFKLYLALAKQQNPAYCKHSCCCNVFERYSTTSIC
jgi:hypothetical protein